MSRERFIDPDTWTSEDICSVSLMADLLFIACISTADDHGRRAASPHCLKASIFPTRGELTADMLRAWRDELAQRGMIRLYRDSDGTEYLDIPAWSRHQHPRYVGKSKIPEYPGAGTIVTRSVQNLHKPPESAMPAKLCPQSTNSAQVSHKPPESAEGCGVDGCGGVCSISSPPVTENVSMGESPKTAPNSQTAGIAHSVQERTAKTLQQNAATGQTAKRSTPISTQEPTASIVEGFISQESFGKAEELRRLVNVLDCSDPVTLLAHMREVQSIENPDSRCALLYRRIMPGEGERIVPGHKAMAAAKVEINARPGPGGGGGARGGPPSSPADALQELLAGKEKSAPSEADPKVIKIFDGLTEGWSGPKDHNHDGEKAIARTMLASNPQKVIAYAYQINGEEIIKGTEPWGRIAEMCGSLVKPLKRYDAKAMQRLSRKAKGGA